jgi:hypothetical protein
MDWLGDHCLSCLDYDCLQTQRDAGTPGMAGVARADSPENATE